MKMPKLLQVLNNDWVPLNHLHPPSWVAKLNAGTGSDAKYLKKSISNICNNVEERSEEEKNYISQRIRLARAGDSFSIETILNLRLFKDVLLKNIDHLSTTRQEIDDLIELISKDLKKTIEDLGYKNIVDHRILTKKRLGTILIKMSPFIGNFDTKLLFVENQFEITEVEDEYHITQYNHKLMGLMNVEIHIDGIFSKIILNRDEFNKVNFPKIEYRCKPQTSYYFWKNSEIGGDE